MTQRVLVQLDVMKQHEKKRLRKYDMIECRDLGKIQLNPYVRTPLTYDFKWGYESSGRAKSAVSATQSNHHVIQNGQSTVQQKQRLDSTPITRKKYSGKPVVRPSSAPACSKCKQIDQRGNLQALGGGFMILKLNPKLKPAHSTTEVQKRRVPEQHITNDLTTGTSSQNRMTVVTVEKGDQLSANQPNVTDVRRNQGPQHLGNKSKVKFCPNGNLSSAVLNGSLLKDNLTKEGERTEKGFIHFDDPLQKKKKPIIPLCIEDEIENPNAKVIRAGCPKAKYNPMKMSESFPVFVHNDEYVEDYILDRWLALYGNKAIFDMHKRGEVCIHLNPVLQNNYNESIAIIGNKKHPPPNVTVKRKKKPVLSEKPKRITIQILSVAKAPYNTCVSSKKDVPFVRKTGASVTRAINRHTIIERNLAQHMPTCSKDMLMIHGVNLKGAEYPGTSSLSLISRVKPQLPIHYVENIRRKGRMVFVDYIPISKPIPIHRSDGELSAIDDSTKIKPGETNKSLVCNQDVFDQKPYQDENRPVDMEIMALRSKFLVQEDSEGSSRLTSSASLKGFPREITNSLESLKLGNMTTRSEEQHIMSTHSAVISIPTAQFDTTESHRDLQHAGLQ